MRNPEIESLQRAAAVSPQITDPRGRAIFDRVTAAVSDSQKAATAYDRADELRLGERAHQFEAGFTYLALAIRMLQETSIVLRETARDERSQEIAQLLHFAGHALREVGQLNRAGDAYARAGAVGIVDRKPSPLAIRSYARAKACYVAVGDAEHAEEMHVREWDSRRLARVAENGVAPLLTFWRLTSKYGTSVVRWALSITVLVAAFAGVYAWMHAHHWIHPSGTWHEPFSPIYLSIVTTLGYGDAGTTHWAAQLFVVLNLAGAFGLLAVGATILGGKVLGN